MKKRRNDCLKRKRGLKRIAFQESAKAEKVMEKNKKKKG